MAKFYGTAYEEHYEKNISDFTTLDWVLFISFWGIVALAVLSGINRIWWGMIVLIGIDLIMIDVMLLFIMKTNSKIVKIFDALGVLTIIGGIIAKSEDVELIIRYGVFVAGAIWLFVGIICTVLAVKINRNKKEYSLIVDATCEQVDVKATNMFMFDDVHSSYFNEMNNDTVIKPAFHYMVNGKEYFTESTIYYGSGNYGFEEGNIVKLCINPENPNEIMPKNLSALVETLMAVFGYIFGIGIIAFLIIDYMYGIF